MARAYGSEFSGGDSVGSSDYDDMATNKVGSSDYITA